MSILAKLRNSVKRKRTNKIEEEVELLFLGGQVPGDELLDFADEVASVSNIDSSILENVGAIELTSGCSIGCSFCGFNAPKLQTEKFNLLEIFVLLGFPDLNKNIFLYWATDPFDWEDEVRGKKLGYAELHRGLIRAYPRYKPYVATAVPKGKEQYVYQNRDILDRLSLSALNRSRLSKALGDRLQEMKSCEIDHLINPTLSANSGTSIWRNYDRTKATEGIGCFDGCLLSPSGEKSILQLANQNLYRERQLSVPLLNRDEILARRLILPGTNQELETLASDLNMPKAEALLSISVPRYIHWEGSSSTQGRPVELLQLYRDFPSSREQLPSSRYYIFSPSGKDVVVVPPLYD